MILLLHSAFSDAGVFVERRLAGARRQEPGDRPRHAGLWRLAGPSRDEPGDLGLCPARVAWPAWRRARHVGGQLIRRVGRDQPGQSRSGMCRASGAGEWRDASAGFRTGQARHGDPGDRSRDLGGMFYRAVFSHKAIWGLFPHASPEEALQDLRSNRPGRPRKSSSRIARDRALNSAPTRPSIEAPVTLLWGADDRLTLIALARDLSKSLPGAELVPIQRAGHLPRAESAAGVRRSTVAVCGEANRAVKRPTPLPPCAPDLPCWWRRRRATARARRWRGPAWRAAGRAGSRPRRSGAAPQGRASPRGGRAPCSG